LGLSTLRVLLESGGAAGNQDGRMEGYSWPRLVISLPASHFSYFSALSAIWQTAKLETAKGQKATGQQGKQTISQATNALTYC